ncbi:MAG: ATP-binding protein [Verrucomicrobia bacterium]|nr:ATP-binding protein [Verrucomicrobiota bacterium]
MDPRFLHHNTHLIDPKEFEDRDPNLRYLRSQKYIYISPLIEQFPLDIPGVYTLSGGRQIGKTTLLKQWMLYLLEKKISPGSIAFLTGELIQDHFSLIHLLQRLLESMPQGRMRYIILDEITYVKDWDKAIKYAKDAGMLDECILFLTGSDTGFLKDARMRFPGRRGKASTVDFHYYPLSFRDTVFLKCGLKSEEEATVDMLYQEFHNYLLHGGFLTAMNDLAQNGEISTATLTTYSDWIRGDMLKRGKHEHYLREIITGIIKRYASQITWNSLAKNQAIDHPQTILDYVSLLEEMDAVFVQQALVEEDLSPAPKKARKIYFADPFIYHALYAWLYPVVNPYTTQILAHIADPICASHLVESSAVTHYRRYWPTYYIKGASGEVDIAYVKDELFWPVEVKWTNQIHLNELDQAAKYKRSVVLTKRKQTGHIGQMPTVPLPVALFALNTAFL